MYNKSVNTNKETHNMESKTQYSLASYFRWSRPKYQPEDWVFIQVSGGLPQFFQASARLMY